MLSRKSPPTSTAAQLKAFLQTLTIIPPATVALHARFVKNVKTSLFIYFSSRATVDSPCTLTQQLKSWLPLGIWGAGCTSGLLNPGLQE